MFTNSQQVINYPRLPYPLEVGSLQWSDKIEDYPTGQITYKGNTLETANAIASSYPDLREISIEGIGFVVSPGGVSVKRSRYGRGDIEVYETVVTLDSKWKAKCQRRISLAPFVQRDLFSRFRFATGVNVAAIASFLRVAYSGPAIFYSPDQTETTFEEILKSNCRRMGCFVRFSDADAVKLISIDGVQLSSFPDSLVIDSGSEKRSPVLPIIDNVAITGKFSDDPFDEGDNLLLPITPQVEVVISGGSRFNSLLTFNEASLLTSREASGRIKSLDLNFDVSGSKKVYSETTYVDGVIQKELIKVYGYQYRAIDVTSTRLVRGKPVAVQPFTNGFPQDFWTQVEEQETIYTYKEIPTTFDISATAFGRFSKVYIHPDSANILSGGGGSVSLRNAKYATGSVTTGWKFVRLTKETEGKYESIYYTPPVADAVFYTARYAARLCNWRMKDLIGKSAFEIAPMRSLYPLTTPFPIEVQVQKYSELSQDVIARANIPAKFKTINGVEAIDPEYTVAIVSAKPDEAEPYWVISESSFKSCFIFGKAPEYNPDLPANRIARARDKGKPEFIFAGEEAYSSIVRQVFENNFDGKAIAIIGANNNLKDKGEAFTETTTTDSGQGSNFVEAEQEAKKETKKGKPPTAQVMLNRWGTAKEKRRIESRTDFRLTTYNRFYASSDLVGTYPADIVLRYTDNSELNLPYATTIAEAQTTLITDLRMVAIQNAIASKKLAWYYPLLRSGDKVSFSTGQLRMTSVSNLLEYRGLQNNVLMVVSEGTQVDCGFDRQRTVNISQSSYNRNSDGAIAPDIRITARGNKAGGFIYNESQRRNIK